ncbi:dTDP-4-dehydrorhamnose reductase [Yersinia alsatica]|uniref:dTDP-4-dehydrorhamnose reductase n=1 Tax=Yersinia alsatica TaxID=2890317 RepID=UPI00119CE14F|nr:dTDP-4-dehydrorhamnose reductase [Yersinia alsatica]
MNILLFGKSGQVGWELQRSLALLGNLIAIDYTSHDYCGDFSNLNGIIATIREIKPDVIVNAAAHTAVDKAESEPSLAELLNATCVEVIAKEAETIGAILVHYSTDYVFDGSGIRPWEEQDEPLPLNTYGKTKLSGELAIQKFCSRYLIFRTSWVYAARGNNFVKTMLKLAAERIELSIINDQYGAPTGAELLADCTAHAIRSVYINSELFGLYHLVASGETTWSEYASFVFSEAKKNGIELAINNIKTIPTSLFPTPAKRPKNSRLNTKKFQDSFNLVLPDWTVGVKRMLSEILEK